MNKNISKQKNGEKTSKNKKHWYLHSHTTLLNSCSKFNAQQQLTHRPASHNQLDGDLVPGTFLCRVVNFVILTFLFRY